MNPIAIGRRGLLATAAAAASIAPGVRPAFAAELKLGLTLSLTGGTDDFGRAPATGRSWR